MNISQKLANLDELGNQLYGEKWPDVRALNVRRLTGEENGVLTEGEVQLLINGLNVLKRRRPLL